MVDLLAPPRSAPGVRTPVRWPARPVLAGILALGLLVGALTAWLWWSRPTAFDAYVGSGPSVLYTDARVGRTLYVGMTYRSDPAATVRIRSAEPVLGATTGDDGSVPVDVEVVFCRLPAGADAGLGSGGRRAADQICTTLESPAGMTLRPGEGQLLLAVTPVAPGRTVVRGVEVDYASGHQSGTQRVGMGVLVKTAGWRS